MYANIGAHICSQEELNLATPADFSVAYVTRNDSSSDRMVVALGLAAYGCSAERIEDETPAVHGHAGSGWRCSSRSPGHKGHAVVSEQCEGDEQCFTSK
jgi:hypothetical protein